MSPQRTTLSISPAGFAWNGLRRSRRCRRSHRRSRRLRSGNDSPTFEVVGDARLDWQEGFVAEGLTVTVDAMILDTGTGSAQAVQLSATALPPGPARISSSGSSVSTPPASSPFRPSASSRAAQAVPTCPDDFDSSALTLCLSTPATNHAMATRLTLGASIVRGQIIGT